MKKSELKEMIKREISLIISQDLGFDYTPGQKKKLPRPIMVVNKMDGSSYLADFIKSYELPLELDVNGKFLKKWKPVAIQKLLKASLSDMYSNASGASNYIPLTTEIKKQFAKEMLPMVKSLSQKFKSWLTTGWMSHIVRAADSRDLKSNYPHVHQVMKTPEYKKIINVRGKYKAQLQNIIKRKQDKYYKKYPEEA